MNQIKKVRKNPIKFKVQLAADQKEAKSKMLNAKVSVVLGPAGSGKTLVCANLALDLLFTKQIERVKITRATVEDNDSEKLGFIPGAQPYSSKILTPNGWVTMGEIKVGDKVYAYDGTVVDVVGTYEHGERDVYEIVTTENQKTLTCDKHLWEAQESNYKRKKNKPKLYSTLHIKENLVNKYGKLKFFLPRANKVEFKEVKLPIDPYLLGCLLGDGSIQKNISFHNVDEDILQKCKEKVEQIGNLKFNHIKNTISYMISSTVENNKPAKEIKITNLLTGQEVFYPRIGEALKHIKINRSTLHNRCAKNLIIDNMLYEFTNKEKVESTHPLKESLIKLNLLGTTTDTKFIPELYKFSSVEQRLELLRGILDTDGTIKKNGEIDLTTTSKQLALDVCEIVRSLGGRANYYTRDRRNVKRKKVQNKKISYQVTITIDNNPFYCKRKAERHVSNRRKHQTAIKEVNLIGKERVKCIKIDHPKMLYITDNYIVTHNTLDQKLLPFTTPVIDNMYKLYDKVKIDSLIKEGKIIVQTLQHIKGTTIDNELLLVDESEDLTQGQILKILTRLGKDSKILFAGDLAQCDLKSKEHSGLIKLINVANGLDYMEVIELTTNHRDPIIKDIIKAFNS